jgi:predicted alpha/beta-fold hydrolase
MTALRELAFPAFRPRPPWWGGDLQTLRNILTMTRADLADWPAERRYFDLGDGDRLAGALHRPSADSNKPVVVLIHGLTGCEDSIHVGVSARHYLLGGYPVLRLNLRGAAPSRPTCRGHYHAGRSEDIAAVFAQLPDFPGIVAVGYSLGGNVLLKHLGETGAKSPLLASLAISVPLDLSATSRCMRRARNRVYHDYMLQRMKEEATAKGAALTDRERAAIETARSVFEYDDRFVAPRFGFAGAEDYYARCAAMRFLDGIETPTLVIHARDDPWIPPQPYLDRDWSDRPALRLLLTDKGGHVGFHGAEGRIPWHDRCGDILFAAVTETIGGGHGPPRVRN